MNDEKKPQRKTGYKSPPVEYQYKKGQSGNQAGRKPKPVRPLLPRQLSKDVLTVGEMRTRVRTPKGEQEVSVYEAIILRLSHKALSGHSASIRQFIQLYESAVLAHFEEFKQYFEGVNMMERQYLIQSMPKDEGDRYLEFLNELRSRTRKL